MIHASRSNVTNFGKCVRVQSDRLLILHYNHFVSIATTFSHSLRLKHEHHLQDC